MLRTLAVLCLGLVAALSQPTAGSAQVPGGCASSCSGCGFGRYEGFGPDNGDAFSTDCIWGCGYCCFNILCEGDNLVSDPKEQLHANVPADEISRLIAIAPAAELSAAVERFAPRLLIHEHRRLLVVTGTSCTHDVVVSVIILSPERTAALRELGVKEWAQAFTGAR